MTDQNTANRQERFVDVQSPLAAQAQASELVQPTDCAFHRPPHRAQAAAVLGVAFGNLRRGADLAQGLAVGFRVVSAIGVQFVEAKARRARLALDRRHIVDQVQQLGHVVAVGRGGLGHDRERVPKNWARL